MRILTVHGWNTLPADTCTEMAEIVMAIILAENGWKGS